MKAELMTRAQSALCTSYKGTLAAAINERLIGRYLVPPRAAEWSGLFRFGKRVPVGDASNVAIAEIIFRNGRLTICLWAGEHADDPATLEHLPPIEAKVIALPTAAAVAPVQPARRGRYPKGVVPLWQLRNQRTSRLIEQQQREEKIRVARQGIQIFEDLASERRGDLALLMASTAELQARP